MKGMWHSWWYQLPHLSHMTIWFWDENFGLLQYWQMISSSFLGEPNPLADSGVDVGTDCDDCCEAVVAFRFFFADPPLPGVTAAVSLTAFGVVFSDVAVGRVPSDSCLFCVEDLLGWSDPEGLPFCARAVSIKFNSCSSTCATTWDWRADLSLNLSLHPFHLQTNEFFIALWHKFHFFFQSNPRGLSGPAYIIDCALQLPAKYSNATLQNNSFLIAKSWIG